MAHFLVAIGLLLLFAGGEALVRGAVGFSRLVGLPAAVVGLVIISAGTSFPELVVSLQALAKHEPDIAAGNIIGANIANILFVLGIGALIRPLPTAPKVVFRDGGALVLASIGFVAAGWDGVIGQMEAYYLLIGLAVFLVISFATDWRKPSPHSVFQTRDATRQNGHIPAGASLFLLALGLVFLYFGSLFLVDGSVALGRFYGISNSGMGLVLLGLGTTLPELAVTIVATIRGRTELAVGNALGSTIFNLLGVAGFAAYVHPLDIDPMLGQADAIVMLGAGVMLVPLLNSGWRISRLEGLLLFFCYALYIAFVAMRENLLPLAALGLG